MKTKGQNPKPKSANWLYESLTDSQAELLKFAHDDILNWYDIMGGGHAQALLDLERLHECGFVRETNHFNWACTEWGKTWLYANGYLPKFDLAEELILILSGVNDDEDTTFTLVDDDDYTGAVWAVQS